MERIEDTKKLDKLTDVLLKIGKKVERCRGLSDEEIEAVEDIRDELEDYLEDLKQSWLDYCDYILESQF